jgi:hypothetical protein
MINPLPIAERCERMAKQQGDKMSVVFSVVAATACGIFIMKELKGLLKDEGGRRER